MGISTEPLKVSINGVDYSAELGKITETFLGYEDHGMLTYNLDLQFGAGSHQGFGSRTPDDWGNALRWILGAVGVDEWSRLRGKSVFALYTGHPKSSLIRGIMSADQQRAYLPEATEQFVKQ